MQEARAERAPEPEVDEETLAALRVSQIGMGGFRLANKMTGQGYKPARRPVQPRVDKGLDL